MPQERPETNINYMFCDDFVTSYISLSAFLIYSQFVTPFYLHLRWKKLAIPRWQEAHGKAAEEDKACKHAKPCHFVKK